MYCMSRWLALLLITIPAIGNAETVSKNFSGKSATQLVGQLTDDTYKWCNFSMPDVVVRSGRPEGHHLTPLNVPFLTPITFIECNFVNRHPPDNAVMIRCNSTIRESAVPVATKETPIYDEDTKTTRTIVINTYEDKIHGKYDCDAKVYKYFGIHKVTLQPVLDEVRNLNIRVEQKIETQPPSSDQESIEKQRALDEVARLEAELEAAKADAIERADP